METNQQQQQKDQIKSFSRDDRLDDLPSLSEQYALDDLLTEHFGFVPKVFTGHLFNIINEAIYDTVSSIEEAILDSYHPNKNKSKTTNGGRGEDEEDEEEIIDPNVPSRDEIARSLNQLETLLCSSIDSQFDLLEIWLHRNVFTFPKLKPLLIKNFSFDHLQLWNNLPKTQAISNGDGGGGGGDQSKVDWESLRSEEEKIWADLDRSKIQYLQSKDDYLSLLSVSNELDKKLASLRSISNQLDQISSESLTIYDKLSNRPLDLSIQSNMIIKSFEKFTELDRDRALIESSSSSNLKNKRSNGNSFEEDEEEEEEDVDLMGGTRAKKDNRNSKRFMIRYEHLLNRLTKTKLDDFLNEQIQSSNNNQGPDSTKGGAGRSRSSLKESEKDENLIEVLNSITGKGSINLTSSSLHPDKL